MVVLVSYMRLLVQISAVALALDRLLLRLLAALLHVLVSLLADKALVVRMSVAGFLHSNFIVLLLRAVASLLMNCVIAGRVLIL